MSSLPSSAIVILQAVLGVALLTFVMAGWAALTRAPAMKRAGIDLQAAAHVSDMRDMLPSSARRVNDNYNHLMEAPTVFYAAAIATVLLGAASPLYAGCAVAYLVLRIAHSLVQATFNSVLVRALLYGLSWVALAPLVIGPLSETLQSRLTTSL